MQNSHYFPIYSEDSKSGNLIKVFDVALPGQSALSYRGRARSIEPSRSPHWAITNREATPPINDTRTSPWRLRRGGVPTGSADHPGARAKAIIGRVVATCGVVVLMPMLLTMMVKSIKDRVDCDIRYVDNWSIISDIPINLRTIVELVRGRNAY